MEEVPIFFSKRKSDSETNVGFYLNLYLERFNEESKSDREIDREIYSKLVGLDTRLGLQTITI